MASRHKAGRTQQNKNFLDHALAIPMTTPPLFIYSTALPSSCRFMSYFELYYYLVQGFSAKMHVFFETAS